MSTQLIYNTTFMDIKFKKESNSQKGRALLRAIEKKLGLSNFEMVSTIHNKQMRDLEARIREAKKIGNIELQLKLEERLDSINKEETKNKNKIKAILQNEENELVKIYNELTNQLKNSEDAWNGFAYKAKNLKTTQEVRNIFKNKSAFQKIKGGFKGGFGLILNINKNSLENRDKARTEFDEAKTDFIPVINNMEILLAKISGELNKYNILIKPTHYDQLSKEMMVNKSHEESSSVPAVSHFLQNSIENDTVNIFHNLEEEMGLEDVNMLLKIQRQEFLDLESELKVAIKNKDNATIAMLFHQYEALKKEFVETTNEKFEIINSEENKENAKTRERLLDFLHGSSTSPNPVNDPIYDMQRISNKLVVTFGEYHKVISAPKPADDSVEGILNTYHQNLKVLQTSLDWLKLNKSCMQEYSDLSQRRINLIMEETNLLDQGMGFDEEVRKSREEKIEHVRRELIAVEKQLDWTKDFNKFPPKGVDHKMFFAYVDNVNKAKSSHLMNEELKFKLAAKVQEANKRNPKEAKKILDAARPVINAQKEIYVDVVQHLSILDDEIVKSYKEGLNKNLGQLQLIYAEQLSKIEKTKYYDRIKAKVDAGKMDLETLKEFVNKKMAKHKEYLPQYIQNMIPNTYLKHANARLLDSTRKRVKAITSFLEKDCKFNDPQSEKEKIQSMFDEVNVSLQTNQLDEIYMRALKERNAKLNVSYTHAS